MSILTADFFGVTEEEFENKRIEDEKLGIVNDFQNRIARAADVIKDENYLILPADKQEELRRMLDEVLKYIGRNWPGSKDASYDAVKDGLYDAIMAKKKAIEHYETNRGDYMFP